MTKNPLNISNFHFDFMADEGHEGQHLVFGIKMHWEVKIQTQYTKRKYFIKEGAFE